MTFEAKRTLNEDMSTALDESTARTAFECFGELYSCSRRTVALHSPLPIAS